MRINVCRRIYIVLSRNISAGMDAFEYNSTTLLEIVKFTYAEPKLIAQNVHTEFRLDFRVKSGASDLMRTK